MLTTRRRVAASDTNLGGMDSPAHTALPDADRLRSLLAGSRWHDVEVVAETGSTNSDLAERADDPGLAGTVLIAGSQRAGRGRHARVWQTPPGQLAISVAVAVPAGSENRIGWLSLLTGLATADAIAAVAAAPVRLKWPNDILAAGPEGGKLAGILAEYRPLTGGGSAGGGTAGGGMAIIGAGINVDFDGDAADGEFTAASVSQLAGGHIDVTELAAAYLNALSDRLAAWPSDPGVLLTGYRKASATLGKQVRLLLPGGTEVVGTAVDVDEQGRIVVDGPGGRVTAAAGDVTHLRPN